MEIEQAISDQEIGSAERLPDLVLVALLVLMMNLGVVLCLRFPPHALATEVHAADTSAYDSAVKASPFEQTVDETPHKLIRAEKVRPVLEEVAPDPMRQDAGTAVMQDVSMTGAPHQFQPPVTGEPVTESSQQ